MPDVTAEGGRVRNHADGVAEYEVTGLAHNVMHSGVMKGEPNPRTASGRWKSMDGHRSPTRILSRKSGLVAIYEREPTPDVPLERALVFESAEFTIELTDFPADWHRMTDDQLSALIKT